MILLGFKMSSEGLKIQARSLNPSKETRAHLLKELRGLKIWLLQWRIKRRKMILHLLFTQTSQLMNLHLQIGLKRKKRGQNSQHLHRIDLLTNKMSKEGTTQVKSHMKKASILKAIMEMTIALNQTLSSLSTLQIHELLIQHCLFIQIGTKQICTSFTENVQIIQNSTSTASITTENIILRKSFWLNLES